ncbi:MAG: cytochrome b N-terminal domain-containing protein [Anaerolineales bacterium]|nr:cytochrome b N-terminal domain-containing protein [Anaerolineales bacterium]
MRLLSRIFSLKPPQIVATFALVSLGVIMLASAAHVVLAGSLGPGESAGATASDPILLSAASAVLLESQAPVSLAPAAAVPPPAQDPCLHCHIAGENTGIWTPLARWVLFGSMGLIFVFGVVRTGSVIVGRKPWKPLTARTAEWVDERYNVSEPLEKILNKPVPRYALRWWYCLGGITAFLFVVQGLTGIMLAFYYKPTPELAFSSIQYIESQVRFGAAVRAIHHWAANGMIVMCIAHMLRVFITGAYKRPRELNWVSGMLLLLLTLVFGFTGYLLPWDQRAFWATTVGTEIAGAIPVIGDLALVFLRVGWDVTGETLSRFFALHVLIVPLATVAFMAAHFLMIRRQGVYRPL